jgi:hypothetical protein
MRALKILVVVMGIMLVAGFAALVVIIAGRLSRGGPAVAGQPFAAAPLDVPAGARIETIGVGAERLVLNILLPNGNRELWVIDLTSGRRLGTIPLRAAP